MKSRFWTLSSCHAACAALLLALLNLTGCNGIGEKDSILARIDGETVYQEDFDLLRKDRGRFHFEKNQVLYTELYSKAALASRAVSEFPELEDEWNRYYKDIDPRILTIMFQRYFATECLMLPEDELRKFYNENRSLFSADSSADFVTLRSAVAKKLYLAKNAEAFDKFLKENAASDSVASHVDTAALEDKFVLKFQQELRNDLIKNIKEKQGVNVHTLPAADPRSYYENHKEDFVTASGYELYQVQESDSAALEKLFTENPTFEQFKQIAASSSKNAQTQKDSGLVGYVKKNFSLPLGIGLVEGLSEELENKNPGFVTKALRGQDGIFHKFYLVRQIPAKVKDFDRAEPGIKAGIDNGEFYDVDSSFVLISKGGKPLLTEAEFLAFNEKFVQQKLNVRNHDRIVNMLAETFAFADAALALKLNRSWEYRAMVRMTRWDFIGDKYLERKGLSQLVPDSNLKELYDRIGSPIHAGYPYEKAVEDLRLVNSIPLNLYNHEYFFGYRLINLDKTFDQSISFTYSRRAEEYKSLYRQRLAAEAYEKATVHLFDVAGEEFKPEMNALRLIARGDSLAKAGNRSAAYQVYHKVMFAYADVDSIFERVAYEMAQVQADNEEFLDAEAEYYAFYRMWPKSANAEKAMFSRGFMLNENLHMNDKALEVLKEFLETYPKSELRESAEWLVKNIESNGKLAEDLMKKIDSQE